MIRLVERLFRAAESRPWTVALALSAPTWVALVRMLLERYLSFTERHLGRQPLPWFLHIAFFYLALLTSLGAVLSLFAKVDWRRAHNLVGMGLLLGTLPPLIDVVALGRGQFAYEYTPGLASIPWLLYRPPNVLPPGETTVLWLSIALMAAYTARTTRSAWRTALVGVVSYGMVLTHLVLAPTAIAVVARATELAPSEWRIVFFGAFALGGVLLAAGASWRFVARLPQAVLPALFVLVGAQLAGAWSGAVWLVVAHFFLAGVGFAIANDWYDRKEDVAQGRAPSPVDGDLAGFITVVPAAMALNLVAFRAEAGVALIGFAIVSHAYHADPLRLKCVFPLSYKTEGLLGGLAAVAGASVVSQSLSASTLWALLVVALGTPVALVFKDWKDVEGDAAAGVRTAFVVAQARGVPGRVALAIAVGLLLAALGVSAAYVVATRGWTPWAQAAAVFAVAAPLWVFLVKRPSLAVYGGMVGAELFLVCAVLGLAPSVGGG